MGEKGGNKSMNNFVVSVGVKSVDMFVCTT